jgi:tetratricopeptide (TPR) repeat protein
LTQAYSVQRAAGSVLSARCSRLLAVPNQVPDGLRCTRHAARCTILLGLAVLTACPGAAADHAKLGDQAVARSDYTTAAAEYRAGIQSSPRPELMAKLGSAAFHLGNFREAAEAYRHLGENEPSRAGEAATGLERVARAAEQAGDALAVREALLGLKSIAPERPTGRIALSLAMNGHLEPAEAIPLLPYALAGATDNATVDSLLTIYADANRETTACEEAVDLYRTVLRRAGGGGPSTTAAEGLAECAVRLGMDAEALEQPAIAERWYREALRVDSVSVLGRRALLGLGNARLGQGDTIQAASAYRAALELGNAADSIGQLVNRKLGAIVGNDSTVNQEH